MRADDAVSGGLISSGIAYLPSFFLRQPSLTITHFILTKPTKENV